jgi:chromosome partitioning protein
MMKTIVIANQKGGVGKTSTIVHLAFDFAERGLRVAVIDLDTQANASFTLQAYQMDCSASDLFTAGTAALKAALGALPAEPALHLVASDANLADIEGLGMAAASAAFRAHIAVLADAGFDVVLIDTAPSLGVGMAAALYAADAVLSPIELEAYSIQGIGRMVTAIANVRQANPSLRFLGMMPSKVDSRNPRHLRHLAELRELYPDDVLPTSIGLRSSIADALASCEPVWHNRKTAARKATKEVRAVAQYVIDQMEIAP